MDQDETNDTVQPENSESTNPEEPTAAHFREAARLAAARVRAALANKPDDLSSEDDLTPPESEDFEDVARKRARSFSGHDPETETKCEAVPEKPHAEETVEAVETPNEKALSKAKRSEALSEIDERLELGARMLRAFESQIQRLERSARTAEAAHEAYRSIPDPNAIAETIAGFEQRVAQSIDNAEVALKNLQQAAEHSNSTANALAGGLETANTVKSLLETTLQTLTEEAEQRSAEVKRTLSQTEAALGVMNEQLKRAEQIEHAVGARLNRAQDAAQQVERASQAALGSIREHIARELSAISTALLDQSQPIEDSPATFEPPLIEVESIAVPDDQPTTEPTREPMTEPTPEPMTESTPEPTSETTPEPVAEVTEMPTSGQQISRGTLSIDESAIKRKTDGA